MVVQRLRRNQLLGSSTSVKADQLSESVGYLFYYSCVGACRDFSLSNGKMTVNPLQHTFFLVNHNLLWNHGIYKMLLF